MICVACGASTQVSPCACGRDPRVDGRYELLGKKDAGHFATIWIARTPTGAVVVAKEIPIPTRDPRQAELARREARILRELHHPAIPRWVDDVVLGRGRSTTLWLFEELIDGDTLEAEIRGRAVPIGETLDALAEILAILEYLHDLQPPVVHRDVKPANLVRRSTDARLVLVDFGAVRDTIDDNASMTIGTFGYMAPEQLHGSATPASDLYAVGAIAAEMLTGRASRELLDWSGRMRWEPHCEVAPELASFVNALLERDPERRLGSAREARKRIANLWADMPRPSVPIRVAGSADKKVARTLHHIRDVQGNDSTDDPGATSIEDHATAVGIAISTHALMFMAGGAVSAIAVLLLWRLLAW